MAEGVATVERSRVNLLRAPLLAAAGAGAAWLLVVIADPRQTQIPLCPLHALTGLYCPFCGGLRAADDLAHGQFAGAIGSNAFFLLTLPLLAFGWGRWLLMRAQGSEAHLVPPASRIPILLLAAALAFAVVRNLPFAAGLTP